MPDKDKTKVTEASASMVKKQELQGEKDTEQQIENSYQKAVKLLNGIKNSMTASDDKITMSEQLIKQFTELSGYKESEIQIEECRKLIVKTKEDIKNRIYNDALWMKKNAKNVDDYHKAQLEFQKVIGYKDAEEQSADCRRQKDILEKKNFRKKVTGTITAALCFVAIIFFATTTFSKYMSAQMFELVGAYSYAISAFDELDHYKDSEEKVIECQYLHGKELVKDKKYKGAINAFLAAGTFKDSEERKIEAEKQFIQNSNIGDTIRVGICDWKILDIVDNKVLLAKKTPLRDRAFNDKVAKVTWETSAMRQWLNGEFLTSTFNDLERKKIILTDVENADNQDYGIDGGNDTKDFLYLLSIDEAYKYHESFPEIKENNWLRTPGNSQDSAAFLTVGGTVMSYGYTVSSSELVTYPVMWFQIN